MFNPIVDLILYLLQIYWWIVAAAVLVSWLIAFNVINTGNHFVRSMLRVLDALTEPVFRLVRGIIPSFGGLDFSPMIVLIAIWFLERVVVWSAVRLNFY